MSDQESDDPSTPPNGPAMPIGPSARWTGFPLVAFTQVAAGREHPELDFLERGREAGDLGQLGHYRILKQIGEGGMGTVFHAVDTKVDREVAVKVIRPDFRGTDAEARFEREARATAQIKHDHVVEIYHFDRIGEVLCLEMPLLRGESLHARLQREKQLPLADVLKIGREMAEGLAAAHAAALIHRDVKPANVFLSQEHGAWRARLLDLGLAHNNAAPAHLTEKGALVGTPAYMSPEQIDGQPLDGRSDLFSLGVVLYHLLTGDNPFAADTVTAIMRRITTVEPPPVNQLRAEAPPQLAQLLIRLLAKDRDGRPKTAAEVGAALRALEHQQPRDPTTRLSVPIPPSAHRPLSRRAVLIGLGAGATAVMLGGAGYAVHGLSQPPILPPLKGYVDVLISDAELGRLRRQNVRLSDPGALPIGAGDKFCIVAELNRTAYVYILWIRANGEVEPAYPWTPGEWEPRPHVEKPINHLRRPEKVDEKFRMPLGTPGMETLVLLARETVLPQVVDVRRELGEVPPQKEQNFEAIVWFENGTIVKDEPGRGALSFIIKDDDPLLALQEQIRTRLGKWFSYTRAVSFAYRGM
jgi:serine/threonine protein kinase